MARITSMVIMIRKVRMAKMVLGNVCGAVTILPSRHSSKLSSIDYDFTKIDNHRSQLKLLSYYI